MINVVIEPLTGTSSGGILLGVHFQGWSHNDGGTDFMQERWLNKAFSNLIHKRSPLYGISKHLYPLSTLCIELGNAEI